MHVKYRTIIESTVPNKHTTQNTHERNQIRSGKISTK